MPRLESPYDWSQVVFQLRAILHLSQEEFAGKRWMNVSVFTISKWETGNSEPQPRYRRRLVRLAEKHGFEQSQWPKKVRRSLRLVGPTQEGGSYE